MFFVGFMVIPPFSFMEIIPNFASVYTSDKSASKCETVYAFSYRDKEYRKCQALICNFIFKNLQNEDIASLIGLIQNEIINYTKK